MAWSVRATGEPAREVAIGHISEGMVHLSMSLFPGVVALNLANADLELIRIADGLRRQVCLFLSLSKDRKKLALKVSDRLLTPRYYRQSRLAVNRSLGTLTVSWRGREWRKGPAGCASSAGIAVFHKKANHVERLEPFHSRNNNHLHDAILLLVVEAAQQFRMADGPCKGVEPL